MFLGMLSIKVIVQNYLDLRQKKSLANNIKAVPSQFKDKISLEEHQIATKYNLEKIRFGKSVRTFRLIILLLWTLGGGLEYLSLISFNSGVNALNTIKFFAFFVLIETLLSIPVSLYSIFVIEEKYGFNKTTPKIYTQDLLKSIILTFALALPLYLGIIKLLEVTGEFWWFYSWAAFVFFQMLLVFIYPKFIAPMFNKFSENESQELRDKIQRLLKKVSFSAKEIYTMDASKRSTHGNAYFTGFGKNKRIVFFDTILEQMNSEEILAILAHELGHFKKRHILKSIISSFFLMLGMFYLLSISLDNPAFLSAHGLQTNISPASIILFSMILPIYTFLISPIGNIISRKNEFEADEFACEHTSGDDLRSALIKLYKFNNGALCTDTFYSNFYDSHPPAMIRLKRISLNKNLNSASASD